MVQCFCESCKCVCIVTGLAVSSEGRFFKAVSVTLVQLGHHLDHLEGVFGWFTSNREIFLALTNDD